MSRLLILVPVLAALVACNQRGREAYYQSRATPTSTADAFGVAAQIAWDDNSRKVYELPAVAPARKGEAPPREDCARPGPKFKAIPMVAWGGRPVRSSGISDSTAMVGTRMDRPAGDDVAIRHHPLVSGLGSPYRPGISQPPYPVKTGAGDLRPRSTTGAGLHKDAAQPMVGYNDRFNPYCERDESMGVLPVDLPPVPEKPSGVDVDETPSVAPRR